MQLTWWRRVWWRWAPAPWEWPERRPGADQRSDRKGKSCDSESRACRATNAKRVGFDGLGWLFLKINNDSSSDSGRAEQARAKAIGFMSLQFDKKRTVKTPLYLLSLIVHYCMHINRVHDSAQNIVLACVALALSFPALALPWPQERHDAATM